MSLRNLVLACGLWVLATPMCLARIYFSPFVSLSSTKSIKPTASAQEKQAIKQKETYGVRAGISMWKLLKVEASVGQSKLTSTEKTVDASVDEYGEIDLQKDADLSTDDPEAEVKTTETTNKARLGIVLDPGFWIFIARAKAGVQATQRIMTLQEAGEEPVTPEIPITYKPYAGAGAGVKLGRMAQFVMEYNFLLYKFPKTEPFEREVSVTFAVNI